MKEAKIKTDNTLKVKKVPCLTKDDILAIILSWNMNWLEQQKEMRKPPPILQEPLHKREVVPVKKIFGNWIHYNKTFLPLMLHELWAKVSRDYEEKKKTPGLNSIPTASLLLRQEENG